jgi:microcystin-dependent protein
MGFLEDLKNGDIKSIILVIFGVLIFHQYWCKSSVQFARSTRQSRCKNNKEPMDNLDHQQKISSQPGNFSDSNIKGLDLQGPTYKEQMANVSNDIKEAVKQVYLADVEAIRNLSEVATKLNNKEGVTIPGNLTVSGTFTSNYLPKGSIVAYNQGSAPPGWTLCDGTQGTPDLRGRFILGNGGSRGINSRGGAETVTLTVNQMPSHNHNVNGTTSKNGHHTHNSHIYKGFGGDCRNCSHNFQPLGGSDGHVETLGAGEHHHSFNVNSAHAGGNAAHNNMPPFYVLTYIMKL